MLENSLDKILQIIYVLTGLGYFLYGIFALITRTCTVLKEDSELAPEEEILRGDKARNVGIGLVILGIFFFVLSYFQCGYSYEYNSLEFNKCTIYSLENLEVQRIVPVLLFLVMLLYFIITVKNEEN